MTSSDNSRRSESPWLLFHPAAFPTTGLILCPLWKSRSLALRSPLAQPLPTAGGHREHREPLPAPLTLAPGLVRLNWARAFVHIYQQSEEKSRFRWSSSPPALELLSRTQRHIGVFTSARGVAVPCQQSSNGAERNSGLQTSFSHTWGHAHVRARTRQYVLSQGERFNTENLF